MLLLVDLDGVVYRGLAPVPGVAAVLAECAAQGDDVVYVTNNSMHYRTDYVTRLAAMGAPVRPETVISSAGATAIWLREHEPTVRRVLAIGAGGLDRELRDQGFEVVTAAHAAMRANQEGIDGFDAAGGPDAVVVGLDPQLTYLRIAVAADAVRRGAKFIATNRDPTYPTERGLRPGAGSVVAAIEVTCGIAPIAIGKPEPHLLEAAAHAVGGEALRAVMIGDSLVADIPAAKSVGARSILMLTGVSGRSEVDALPPAARPDEVAADAAELATAIERLREVVAGGV